jgi:hypothetical protein
LSNADRLRPRPFLGVIKSRRKMTHRRRSLFFCDREACADRVHVDGANGCRFQTSKRIIGKRMVRCSGHSRILAANREVGPRAGEVAAAKAHAAVGTGHNAQPPAGYATVWP